MDHEIQDQVVKWYSGEREQSKGKVHVKFDYFNRYIWGETDQSSRIDDKVFIQFNGVDEL